MLSIMADRLGFRDGVLVADRVGGGGLTGPYHVSIGLICADTEQDVVAQLTERAIALGYEPGRHPGMLWKYSGTIRVMRFVKSDSIPDPEFATVAPGEPVYGMLVPERAAGVLATVHIGATMTDGGRRDLKTLNAGTAARMAELGISVAGPPSWQRFWFWWWIRAWRRRKLTWAAWRLGAYRGRVVANWFVGGDAVGPYSFGIATIRPGDGPLLIAQIAANASSLGLSLGHGLAGIAERFDTERPEKMIVSAISFGPGERLLASADSPAFLVPPGSSGIVVTITDPIAGHSIAGRPGDEPYS